MNIIKKINIVCVLTGGLLLSSCDSYLDIQPIGKVIPNTLTEYRALLTSAYSTKLNDRGVTEFRTDIAEVSSGASAQNYYADIEQWNDINSKDGTREFFWGPYYSVIYYANAIINKKNEITEGSQEDIDQLVGEAYLLRGYMHFLLVNLYGQPYTKSGAPDAKSIPLKWNMELEEISPRNTVKEVYAAILSDIQTARGLIQQKEWEIKYSYRFSTLSVDAMESRVRLYMGDWQNSYDASKRVLTEKSTLENLNDSESKLPNDFSSVEMITAYENIYTDDASSASLLSQTFLKEYEESKDMRRNKYYTVNNDGNYVSSKSGASKFNCTFRTGEIYLNAAEAAAHLNKLSEARVLLLKLIENRYAPTSYAQKENVINSMTQNALITEILKERARELAFEGHRWFDLRRTTRPRIEKELNGNIYVLAEDDPRYTLRIPQAAIDANPGLLN